MSWLHQVNQKVLLELLSGGNICAIENAHKINLLDATAKNKQKKKSNFLCERPPAP